MDLGERRSFLAGETLVEIKGTIKRTQVSNAEIWSECFGKRPEDLSGQDSFKIAGIMATIPGWKKSDLRVRMKIYGQQRVYIREEKV